ncbi:MAG: hypothetical protein ACLFQ5_09910 [Oceanicaulis sp.]
MEVTDIRCSETSADRILDALADQMRDCARATLEEVYRARPFAIERRAMYAAAVIETAAPAPDA